MKKLILISLFILMSVSVLGYGGAIGGFIMMPQAENNAGNNYLFHQQLDNIKYYSYQCSDSERIVWEPLSLNVLNTCSDDIVRSVDLELDYAVKKGYFDVAVIWQSNQNYLGLKNVYQVIDVRMSGKGDATLTLRLPDGGYTLYKQKKSFGFFRPKIEWVAVTSAISRNDYTFEVSNEAVLAAVKNA